MRFADPLQRLLSQFYYRRYERVPRLYQHLAYFCDNERKSRDELESSQLELLRQLLRHARDNTRYYRRVFDQAGLNPETVKDVEAIACLPILTKEIIEREFDNLTAQNIAPSDCHISYTGGTRGKKTRFLRDNECRARRIALQWRCDMWTGWKVHDKVAYIWPAFQDVSVRDEFKQFLIEEFFQRTKLYYAGALSGLRAENIYHSLLRYKPSLIRGFPSPMEYLARCLREFNLTVPGLTGIVSTGEPISPAQKELIETAFDTEVFNLYASRENGTIAAECQAHGALHTAIDSVLVQIDTTHLVAGRENEGNLLVTDLHNYAMPMIRYEIGDYGALLPGSCSCGMNFPLMQSVVGRIADGFWDLRHRFVSPIALGEIMEVSKTKRVQAQLVQEPDHAITVRIAKSSATDRQAIDCICSRLKDVFGDVPIDHELVREIRPEPSGKYRFSICHIDPADNATHTHTVD